MRRLYYFKVNGEIYFQTRNDHIGVKQLTIEQEFALYKTLQEVNRELIDVIEIGINEYAQDFAECDGYRVNPETKQIEFSYPDPNEPGVVQPFQAPLSEEVARLKQEDLNNKEAIAELYILSMGGF